MEKYAIIESGGKQYRVSEGDELQVERLDADEGEELEIAQVLMVVEGDERKVGAPAVEGAKVVGRVLEHGKGPKIRGFKYKAKKNYRRRWGHRQPYTKLKIEKIEA